MRTTTTLVWSALLLALVMSSRASASGVCSITAADLDDLYQLNSPCDRQFEIRFEAGSCELDIEARNILQVVNTAFGFQESKSIRVVGHTDTYGSQEENNVLSVCRAEMVKTNLTEQKVPAAAIQTSGKGETELAVITADGEHHPANNRVEIELHE